MGDTRSLSIRIDDDVRVKLRFIAKYYGRSANAHIMFLIRQDIEEFEQKHGKIEVDEG